MQMLLLDFDRTWLPGLCIQIECATCPFTNSSLTSPFTFSLCLLSDCELKTPIWTKLLEILSWHHSASQHLCAHYMSPYHFFKGHFIQYSRSLVRSSILHTLLFFDLSDKSICRLSFSLHTHSASSKDTFPTGYAKRVCVCEVTLI